MPMTWALRNQRDEKFEAQTTELRLRHSKGMDTANMGGSETKAERQTTTNLDKLVANRPSYSNGMAEKIRRIAMWTM